MDRKYRSIFEFRMSGEPHLWEGNIDLREVSIDEMSRTVLIKMDGTNNKTKAREQVQLHFSQYMFEQLIEAINQVIPEYKEKSKEWK